MGESSSRANVELCLAGLTAALGAQGHAPAGDTLAASAGVFGAE